MLRPFFTYPDANLKTLERHYHGAKCKNSPICFTESWSPHLSVQLFEQAHNYSSAQLPPLYMSTRCLNISQGLSTPLCSFPSIILVNTCSETVLRQRHWVGKLSIYWHLHKVKGESNARAIAERVTRSCGSSGHRLLPGVEKAKSDNGATQT